jgi:hypothetical protein
VILLAAESRRTYDRIEPSTCSIKDRVIQIIGFSALLLWLIVYVIKTIDFNKYANGALIDDSSLIKAILFIAAFFFTVSVLLGMWAYYRTKRAYSNDSSKWMNKAATWLLIGLFILLMSIPPILFPESDRFSSIYLIALTYAGKHVMGKISKDP